MLTLHRSAEIYCRDGVVYSPSVEADSNSVGSWGICGHSIKGLRSSDTDGAALDMRVGVDVASVDEVDPLSSGGDRYTGESLLRSELNECRGAATRWPALRCQGGVETMKLMSPSCGVDRLSEHEVVNEQSGGHPSPVGQGGGARRVGAHLQ